MKVFSNIKITCGVRKKTRFDLQILSRRAGFKFPVSSPRSCCGIPTKGENISRLQKADQLTHGEYRIGLHYFIMELCKDEFVKNSAYQQYHGMLLFVEQQEVWWGP